MTFMVYCLYLDSCVRVLRGEMWSGGICSLSRMTLTGAPRGPDAEPDRGLVDVEELFRG